MSGFRRAAYYIRNTELWRSLPPEAQQVYAVLEPREDELQLSQGYPRLRENRIALEALVALCGEDSELAASTIIPKYSPHLRGSSLERTLYEHAIEARNNPRLKAIMTPAIGNLIDVGVSRITKYVASWRPLSLDEFRAGFTLLRTAALFNPEAIHNIENSLRRTFSSRTKQYPIIDAFLPSVAAWGSDPARVSESDLSYMNYCRTVQDSPRQGLYFANHVLAYYALPRQGRRLTEMMPEHARQEMLESAEGIRESLIDEASHKCQEGYANAAWIGATFLKIQMGINYLDGCWTKLSPSQARKLQNFILFARHETQCLDGRDRRWLHANMSSVETTLIRHSDYGLRAKIYRER